MIIGRTKLCRCPRCREFPEIRLNTESRFYYVCTHCAEDAHGRISSDGCPEKTIAAARRSWNRMVRTRR